MTTSKKTSPDMEIYVKLRTPKGIEYIIDADGDVFGPWGITKKRIEYHVIIGGLKYNGPGSGYPLGIIADEFENKKWIKVVDCKVVSDEEAELAKSGKLIY